MGEYSRILFATPSFSEGVARILDFGNTLNEYNYSPNSETADQNAIMADWNQVGADLRRAIRERRADAQKVEATKKAAARSDR